VSHDKVEELAAVGILHDHEELFIRFYDLIELDNVGMAHLLEDFNLARNSLNILLIVYFVLFKDLDSHLFSSEHVGALFDLAESALSKSLAYIIKKIGKNL